MVLGNALTEYLAGRQGRESGLTVVALDVGHAQSSNTPTTCYTIIADR